MQNTFRFKAESIVCIYDEIMYLIYLVEDEDFAFPSDTFVSMKKGILPVVQIDGSEYGINWIPTPSSYINQLSSDNEKKDNFLISHPSPGIGKMKKNNQPMSEPSIFIPEMDPTMLNGFNENLVTRVLCT